MPNVHQRALASKKRYQVRVRHHPAHACSEPEEQQEATVLVYYSNFQEKREIFLPSTIKIYFQKLSLAFKITSHSYFRPTKISLKVIRGQQKYVKKLLNAVKFFLSNLSTSKNYFLQKISFKNILN